VTAPERDDETLEAELVDDLVEVESTVVSLFRERPAIEAAPVDDEDEPDEEEYRTALSRRLETVATRPILPPKGHATAVAKRVGRDLGRSTAWAATHPHRLVGAELRPVARGVAVTWRAWRTWATEKDFAATVVTTPAGTPGHSAAAKDLAKLRSGHRRLSTFVALILLVGLVTLWFLEPLWLVPVGLVVFALFDLIGRRNPPEGPTRTIRRTLLQEGAPLGALAKQIIQRLNEDKVRADLAAPMTVHAGGEYRMRIVHEDAIEPKHLRSLEMHLAARPLSLRLIGTEDSGLSELRLPTRDHLAHVPPRPWAPTGSRTIADPADLWVRSDGDPSRPVLAGVHVDLVGTTGAGKTEAVQELISHFGECRDVYPVLVDLTMGPVGPLNRRVLRKTAYTLEEAEALLDWVLAQVSERHMVLHRLAESDDDDAPTEWDLDWGPQVELIVDEYSFLAVNDELHEKVEQIMRVGRKVKVCVVRASQKSGTKDLGSTLAASLVGLKILLACQESDTTKMLSTGHRDRGWSPHEFRPAVPGDARDAGKCFVWGPSHRDPEIHRFHAPLEPGEVKRRDRRRAADGLPNLDGTPAGEQPAMLLTPLQAEVERVFADRGEEWLPTTEVLLPELVARGHQVTSSQLSDELCRAHSKRDWNGRRQLRGYALADIRRAWGVDE
jgi:hypothetical protein